MEPYLDKNNQPLCFKDLVRFHSTECGFLIGKIKCVSSSGQYIEIITNFGSYCREPHEIEKLSHDEVILYKLES